MCTRVFSLLNHNLDAGFHAEMKGRKTLSLCVGGLEHGQQPLEPAFGLTVNLAWIGDGEIGRIVALDEGLHQRQSPRLGDGGFELFVGD